MMIRKHFTLGLLLLLILTNIQAQKVKYNETDLLGKWKSYKVTTLDGKDGSDITFDEKPFNKKVMMNFINKDSMLFSINGSEKYKMKYSLRGNKIIISYRKYIIEKLEKKLLILKEEKVLPTRIYLKKDDG